MCHAPTVHLETCFFLFFLFFFAGLTQFMLLETMELSQIQTYLIGVLLFINFFFYLKLLNSNVLQHRILLSLLHACLRLFIVLGAAIINLGNECISHEKAHQFFPRSASYARDYRHFWSVLKHRFVRVCVFLCWQWDEKNKKKQKKWLAEPEISLRSQCRGCCVVWNTAPTHKCTLHCLHSQAGCMFTSTHVEKTQSLI